jgi:site-specific DNA-cytosine methylase
VRHASFFSGVGGLDLGFERAGIETVSVSEIDPYANAVLAERFPDAPSNSGMAFRGELWTLATSESPSDAVECSLSQVLNPTAPQRFSLSAKAASGILRRAGRRGKVLPAALQTALESLAQSPDDSAKESIAPLTNHSSSVRRLTPTECERLMGWPDGWTISKAWIHSARRRTAPSKPETGKQE